VDVSVVEGLRARYGAAVDAHLNDVIRHPHTDPALQTMLAYQLGFVNADGLAEGRSGKRFRSALCLCACEHLGSDWRRALPVAAAIELLHNFSLIHDDIEDGDTMRRHRPTVWYVWGEPHGINAGDAMFALATRVLLDAPVEDPAKLNLVTAFQDLSLHLTSGQYLDMSFEDRAEVRPDEYMCMINGKTAALVAFSLMSGAQVADASPPTVSALEQFGLALGRGFQIQDDLLGIWGAADATGKPAGSDLRNRKKTLPLLLAWQRADMVGREELNQYFARQSDDLDAVMTVLNQTDSRAATVDAIQATVEEARMALQAADMSHEGREILFALADELTGQRPRKSAGTVANP